jgi:ribosomal RNA-processing protein 36
MSSIKRKSLDTGFQRRVRARREASEEVESSETSSGNGDNRSRHDENNSDSGEFSEEVCTIPLSFGASLTIITV